MDRSKGTGAQPRGVESQGHCCTMWLGQVQVGSWRTWQERGGKVNYSQIIKAKAEKMEEQYILNRLKKKNSTTVSVFQREFSWQFQR